MRGLYRQIVMSCALSALAAALAEFFLLFNLSYVDRYFTEAGRRGLFSAHGYQMYVWMMLFVGVGLLVFLLTLFLLEHRTVDYTLRITRNMERISEGDLDVETPVEGDNELSVMAEDLNTMASGMKQLIEREREAERQKNELITNVAHDLRTPLTSVTGYLRLLAMPGLSEEDRAKYLSIATGKAEQLGRLIENLFDYTSMSFEGVRLHPEELDLVGLLAQLLDEFYPVFDSRGMIYELTAEEDSLPMTADGNLLVRLFENLIGNAVKYGADGKRVEVSVRREGAFAHTEVRNYGETIPEDKLEHVFDKLYRAEESRDQKVEGNGLGLAIVKNIAQLHGGRVSVRSDLDGTVFSVDLPVTYRGPAAGVSFAPEELSPEEEQA